ncbi:hypothetical protein F4861DRAFT_541217 [Xylaria intraflava]|nr:hypothetical protein F4861DRAFT_541217 [Xylaria intraflava]
MYFHITCKLCGLSHVPESDWRRPSWLGVLDSQWWAYYRAVYCVDSSGPRLSGLASSWDQDVTYLPPEGLPPEAHQRFDDLSLDPLSSIIISAIGPPSERDGERHKPEKGVDAWGFHLHDSCWRLLEQACAPQPVDLKLFWRVLISFSHLSPQLIYGFLSGIFHFNTVSDQHGTEHFTIYESSKVWYEPSTYHDPMNIPELQDELALMRTKTDVQIRQSELLQPIRPSPTASTAFDPFMKLPVEIREMILGYTASRDVLSFRLSSRAMATTPLSRYFFKTRFSNEQQLEVYFDAFILESSGGSRIDWEKLYYFLKQRIENNRIGLGETNRIRIWTKTAQPLAQMMKQVSTLSELKGVLDYTESSVFSNTMAGTEWKSIRTSWFDRHEAEKSWSSLLKAQIFLPQSDIEAIHVSHIEICGSWYVTGLTFTTEQHEDIEIGYIRPGRKKPLIVENGLKGFYAAVDECGFQDIAAYTGPHMETQRLDWGLEGGALVAKTIKSNGDKVRRVHAIFDEFKLRALSIPM